MKSDFSAGMESAAFQSKFLSPTGKDSMLKMTERGVNACYVMTPLVNLSTQTCIYASQIFQVLQNIYKIWPFHGAEFPR